MALVAALALPASALALYLLTATAFALLSHANLRVPSVVDRLLRGVFVTPPVHAVHHSDLRAQTDSNFGMVLTVWDRLFGTYANPERTRITRFGLAYFHLANDTGLGRVLLQPFLFRRDLSYPQRGSGGSVTDSAVVDPARSDAAWVFESRGALLAGALACALLTVAMWPAVATMAAAWRNSESYQFAWLVAPMVVYVVGWHVRPPVDVRPDLTGAWLVAIAAACWVAASLMNIDVGRQFAYVLSLHGVAMSTFGWRSYRRLFPALALLFLMIPSGDLLQPALRLLTLRSIELFASVAQLPHSVDGFVIYIGTHRYIVVDECSGLVYVTLASFLGYSFGLLVYRSLTRVVAMALLGAAVGIGINVLRVNSIVLIDWLRGSQMELSAHGAFQWLALFAGLGILFFVLWRLNPEPAPDADVKGPTAQARGARKLAPVFVGLLGVAVAGGVAQLPRDAPLPLDAAEASAFPRSIGGWEIDERRTVRHVDQDGRLETVQATYVRDSHDITAVRVTALQRDAKLPESRLAPDDRSRWREKGTGRATGCADAHCVAFVHAVWERGKGEHVRHVYYAYTLGGFVTDSRFAIRAAQAWGRVTGESARPRLIGFISDGALGATEVAAALSSVTADSTGSPSSPDNG